MVAELLRLEKETFYLNKSCRFLFGSQ